MEIFGLGIQELLIILLIVLLLFGAKKLPELSRSIGESMKELRRGFTDDVKKTDKDAEKDKTETKS